MKNPYKAYSRTPMMIYSVVAFLDILGFQRMVLDRGTNQLLQSLSNALQKAKSHVTPEDSLGGRQPSPWVIKVFTDNIVFGAPIFDDGEAELGTAFMRLAAYQLEMALEGFFVRGGLAVGLHYMDEDIVFGPTIVEAYELESQKARDPRIVLGTNAMDLAKSHTKYYADPHESPQNNTLLIDADNQCFINYLSATVVEDYERPYINQSILLVHKDQIVKKLDIHHNEPNIWSKYVWLANYHNYFCTENKLPSKLLIDQNLLSIMPKRFVI